MKKTFNVFVRAPDGFVQTAAFAYPSDALNFAKWGGGYSDLEIRRGKVRIFLPLIGPQQKDSVYYKFLSDNWSR